MHKNHLVSALAGILTVLSAHAATIDFNLLSGNQGSSFVAGGVTFSTSGSGGISVTATPNGTPGLLEDSSPRMLIRAVIAGGASFVSVDLGDFGGDADKFFLEIFDVGNNKLAETSLTVTEAFVGMQTLSLSASGISYALFGSTVPSLNGSSAFADNFTFSSAPAGVPDGSSSILLLTMSLAAIGSVARRHRKSNS